MVLSDGVQSTAHINIQSTRAAAVQALIFFPPPPWRREKVLDFDCIFGGLYFLIFFHSNCWWKEKYEFLNCNLSF